MGKGTRREREARELYESAGYWVYSPQNPKFGDNDLWNLFDLAAYRRPTGDLRFVQVKSNGARGIKEWSTRARHFRAVTSVNVDFVVPYDREGWRLIKPLLCGTASDDRLHTTLYDERNGDVAMGDGIVEYLRGGANE